MVMVRRKVLIIFLISLIPCFVSAQTAFNVYNDGLTDLVLESGLTATILGGYISQTNTVDGVLDNQSVIELTGNWENNNAGGANPFTVNTGTIKLIGTTEQTVGGTATTIFNNLEVNNTAASGGIILSKIIYITNTLTLNDGIINTSSASPLVMNSGSTSGSGSVTSYVDGPMRKEGNTAYTFPLGNGGVWARLTIGSPSSSTTFEAQYFNAAYTNTTSMAASPTPILNNVSTIEYWTLTRTAGTGTTTVNLHWENAATSSINSCPDLKLARWNGGAWENTYNTSGSGSCSGTGAGFISSGTAVTTFTGPLTFGSLLIDPSNPLPIELKSFNAELVGDVVMLSWTTASELNNDFFTVEKSQDAINFKKVVDVEGAGNSATEVNYSARDNSPYFGFSYYRLKQTDFNGAYEYSDLVIIQNDKEIRTSIFPNPVVGNTFYLSMEGSAGQEVLVTIFNTMGKRVYSKTILQQNGSMVATINLPKMRSGLYILVGSTSKELFRQKLIVNQY
jgi:type IX secretion system substrate protein